MLNVMPFEKIKLINEKAYKFLISNDLAALAEKKYELGDDIYVNVESYVTHCRCDRKYESHNRYVDIQCIISGKEKIEVVPYTKVAVVEPYDFKRDITFYDNSYKGESYGLTTGECLIIHPQLAHMPCLYYDDCEEYVKKAVIKIPVNLLIKPKILVMDVDGTLTDGKIYMGNAGESFKAFNIKDGCGIHDILPLHEIIPAIITGRESAIVKNRCKEIGIEELYQGVSDKVSVLNSLANAKGYELSDIAYIGDDLNDMSCMNAVKEVGGLVGCPADAIDDVKKIATFVSKYNGGCGAVRDFIEWICKR